VRKSASTPASCVLSLLVLSACGGGGGEQQSAPGSGGPTAYPAISPTSGDYFVYTDTRVQTIPAGTPTAQETVTRYFKLVNPDGSSTRSDSFSSFFASTTQTFDSSGALVTYASGNLLCSYGPAFRSGPPLSAVVGGAYGSSTSQTCAQQPGGAPATTAISLSGQALAVEQVTIPLGTFSAFKYAQTTQASDAGGNTTTNETCWISTATGQPLQCTTTFSTVQPGQSAVVASGSTTSVLDAYSFGGTTAGAIVKRFSGFWNIQLAGGATGKCDNLFVDVGGGISGSCAFLTSPGVFAPAFSVSGAVSAAGAATLTSATGASLSGTFNTPVSATGTWTNGGTSGAWTATHV
jgi:hypothetical protein